MSGLKGGDGGDSGQPGKDGQSAVVRHEDGGTMRFQGGRGGDGGASPGGGKGGQGGAGGSINFGPPVSVGLPKNVRIVAVDVDALKALLACIKDSTPEKYTSLQWQADLDQLAHEVEVSLIEK